jgi:hypothetical protein
MMPPGVRAGAEGAVLLVEDEPRVHREATHVMEQAGELELLVRARVAGELGALERMRQLGDGLPAVEPRRRAGKGLEQRDRPWCPRGPPCAESRG